MFSQSPHSNESGTPNGNRIICVVAAIGLLSLVVWLAGSGAEPAGNSPAECVTAMIVAEQSGDVEAYLRCFAGPLRRQLEARKAGRSTEGLAAQLKNAASDSTGLALIDVERPEPDVATLTLERAYRDYTETHQVRLEKQGGQWRIVELTPQGRFAPEIPYGTPVSPAAKEDAESAQADSPRERSTRQPQSTGPRRGDP